MNVGEIVVNLDEVVAPPHQFAAFQRVSRKYFLAGIIVNWRPFSNDVNVRVDSTSHSPTIRVSYENCVELAVW